MAEFKDLTGQKFGRLTVIDISRKIQSGKRERYYWKCKCECGNMKEVRTDSLTSGNVTSCGCLKLEQDRINLTAGHKHKLSKTHIWNVYYGMLHRCYNPQDSHYKNYGGRGIEVCEEWRDSIEAFAEWAQKTGFRDGLTIDRVDNDGNYEPVNCRWATMKEQSRNRRSNIVVSCKGEDVTLIEASEKSGLPYSTLQSRWRRGIRGEELFAEPAIQLKKREVLYNGKKVTLRELSELTGIKISTLGSRYREGKRGEELIKQICQHRGNYSDCERLDSTVERRS